MKKISFLILACVIGFLNKAEAAEPQEKYFTCMQQLPETIIVDKDSSEFNFTKSPLVDSFWNYEKEDKGGGYAQMYQSGSCFLTVSLYDDEAGRLTGTKIKRQMKSTVQFKQTDQDTKKVKGVRFSRAIGAEQDQINVVMMGAYKDKFLKIKNMCQYLPRMGVKDHEKMVIEQTEKVARDIVLELNSCFRK